MKLTVRDLRSLLFEIEEQEMTIVDLRSILFKEDQEIELNEYTGKLFMYALRKNKEV